MQPKINQYPETGKHLLRYCGDTLEIRMRCDRKVTGTAFLSTNIGNAPVQRKEVVNEVQSRLLAAGQDWANIPMERMDDFTFRICLALHEPGHFECKVCLVTDEDADPLWAPGDNLHVNVIAASYCCANSIYCAFPRQFGRNRNEKISAFPDGINAETRRIFDGNGYALIPPSGTFRDVIRQLDHIIGTLKCRILHLLPVNPTPTVYGRMGRFGSPYAALDFTAVDPALAEFDKKATPLDQFQELTDAVHARHAKLFIDIAINHTGWASKLQETHPEWFVHEPDGEFHSPGAWGTVWEDLVELDSEKYELWHYLADVFLTWCQRGVDGFRCDAGYMIPEAAWRYIIAKVRLHYPETVFLLEGLGGDPAVTSSLLDTGNMDWAYSELFQNYTRDAVEGYLRYAWRQSSADGIMVHYAETHDNSRLAAVSEQYAKMRTALCALTSVSGAFGFANGVEWFATEKIDVHEDRALNWGAPENQVRDIARLNGILAVHPAFHDGALLQFLDSGSPDGIVILRETPEDNDPVLICINLNCNAKNVISWDPAYITKDFTEGYDLISGKRTVPVMLEQRRRSLTLPPGAAVCLSPDSRYLTLISEYLSQPHPDAVRIQKQEAAAMAMALLCKVRRSHVVPGQQDVRDLADRMLQDPEHFLDTVLPTEIPCVTWEYPVDSRREVMLPPDHVLLVTAPERFRVTVTGPEGVVARKDSLCDGNGRSFAILPPIPVPRTHTSYRITVRTTESGRTCRLSGKLLLLAEDMALTSVSYTRQEIYNRNRTFLQGNGRGAVIHQPMELGRLDSRYDAILLANLNEEYPEDRHIMFRRIRIWINYKARLQELKHDHIASFHLAKDGGGIWHYHCPVGNGLLADIFLKMQIVPGRNAVLLTVSRGAAGDQPHRLSDDAILRVRIRPDIEDRNFHTETKASAGPEQTWQNMIRVTANGFEFAPAPNRIFHMQSSRGHFKSDPEWTYMIHQQNEADRGLDPCSDVYSPGYFRFYLSGGESTWITGEILAGPDREKLFPKPLYDIPIPDASGCIEPVMLHSMRQFVVKRERLKTVIAGYPWFLDWGRDTLIAARGLLAAPEFRNDVADILVQFASFAEKGTIPNMISGGNASNRDTSDAPLWLFRAVADYCNVTGSVDFLSRKVRGEETMLDILSSIADYMISGVPNGIRMDKDSGLIYSPPHFTWMDTNYPAGTPREGYPIEIQALWYSALAFLGQHAATKEEREQRNALAEKVRASVLTFFRSSERRYLSDCLHATAGVPASEAVADDHLRPNQLFAITLGLIDDPVDRKNILEATRCLLIPGAIRTLADKEVKKLHPIYGNNGTLLNDPAHPYQGRYEGDEDTRRKAAYHNGTAWPWVFPSWPEAYFMTYGRPGRRTAISVLSTMTLLMDGGCITQLPEILDGDIPHKPRGCDAQAWSVTEFYRVWAMLHHKTNQEKS